MDYRETPVLEGVQRQCAEHWIAECVKVASAARCLRAKAGSIIVSDDWLPIASGVNSPPGQCLATCTKDYLPADFRSDRTCCTHAEQAAIQNALRTTPNLIAGSTLFFARLGDEGALAFAGEPYCTICSKMALEVGISLFVLYHEDGIRAYNTEHYNALSFGMKPDLAQPTWRASRGCPTSS